MKNVLDYLVLIRIVGQVKSHFDIFFFLLVYKYRRIILKDVQIEVA